jgi:hypothetical protein
MAKRHLFVEMLLTVVTNALADSTTYRSRYLRLNPEPSHGAETSFRRIKAPQQRLRLLLIITCLARFVRTQYHDQPSAVAHA